MSGWTRVKLSDVATIDRSSVKPSEIPANASYVGLENIEKGGRIVNVLPASSAKIESTKFRFTKEQVLFGKLRPYLAKVARPNFEGVCSTDILPITPGPNLDRNYLAHFLAHPSTISLASSRASGANLPRLSPTELAKFSLHLPPIGMQRKMADVLDRADALRAKRRAAIALLDDLAQSIFFDMFGDPKINPKGFPVKALADFVAHGDRINYGVVQPGEDKESGVPLIRVGNLVDDRVDHSSLKRISPEIEEKYHRSRLKGNEILVGCVGSIGTVAIAGKSEVGFNVARAVARIPIASDVERFYVAHHLKMPAIQSYFVSQLRTVAQPTLNIKQLSEAIVMAPPVALQEEFFFKVSSLHHLRKKHAAHLSGLDDLFGSLQQRAFRGELWHA